MKRSTILLFAVLIQALVAPIGNAQSKPNLVIFLSDDHTRKDSSVYGATDIKTPPAYLQELGYEVVAFGKVSHYKQTVDYGFDYFAHDGFHEDIAVQAAVDWLNKRKSDKPLCLFVGSNWPHVPWPTDPGDHD